MNKPSIFVASIAAVFAIAGPAAASPAHYLTYTGSTEQAPDKGVHYLTYTGNTEQTPSGAPQGMSDQQLKAALIRGAALNKRYHLGAYAAANLAAELRGKALNAKYGNEWTRMSSQQFAALVNMFGTDVTQLSPKQLQQFVAKGESGSSSSSFGWGSAGIGALAALGVALLLVAARRLRHTPAIA